MRISFCRWVHDSLRICADFRGAGKDTTYVVDFVNDPAEVLAAFKTYQTTVELAATTDPNLVFNLHAKLDAAGHYDTGRVAQHFVSIHAACSSCRVLQIADLSSY